MEQLRVHDPHRTFNQWAKERNLRELRADDADLFDRAARTEAGQQILREVQLAHPAARQRFKLGTLQRGRLPILEGLPQYDDAVRLDEASDDYADMDMDDSVLFRNAVRRVAWAVVERTTPEEVGGEPEQLDKI